MNPSFFSRSWVRTLGVFLFLFASAFALYFKSLPAEFVLDAHCVVVNNPVLKQPQLYRRILTEELFSACHPPSLKSFRVQLRRTSLHDAKADEPGEAKHDKYLAKQGQKETDFEFNYYRPMTLFSLAVDYRLWKLNPWGYKFTNLILHSVNAFLVYLLMGMIFGRRDLAFLASGYFLIFPIHEWVVNYVVGRADLLQAFFQLSSLIVLIPALALNPSVASGPGPARTDNRRLGLSLFLFILAVLSRENAVLMPLFVFAVAHGQLKDYKKALRCSFPFLIVSILYLAFRSVYLPIGATGGTVDWARLGPDFLEGLRVWITSAMRFVLPWVAQVNLLGPWHQSPWKLPLAGCILVVCVGLALGLWRANRNREQAFGWVWILINFLPLLSLAAQFKYLGPVLSEHYLYLSSVGFSVILSGVLLMARGRARWVLVGASILYYCVIVLVNNSTWTTEENILRRVSRLEGGQHHVAREALLTKYSNDTGLVKKLIDQSTEAAMIARWTGRLATIELERQDYTRAQEHFLKAIHLGSTDIDHYLGLATAQFTQGKKEETVLTLHKGLELNPESEQLYRFLGVFYYQEGKMKEAEVYLKNAYFYNPDNQDNVLYWGISQFLQGSRKEAYRLFAAAMRLDPQSSFACRFIAAELYKHKFLQEALAFLKENKKRFSNDPELLLLTGKIYFNLGQFDQALYHCQEVLRVMPEHPEAAGCSVDLKEMMGE